MQDFDKIALLLGKGGILLTIASILVYILWKLLININHIENLYDFITVKRKKSIREDINDNNLEEGIREILKENYNHIRFKKISGIHANKKLRSNIYSLIKNPAVNIADIRKSKRYIKTDNSLLSIVITPKDKNKYKGDRIFNRVLLVASILYFILFVLIILGIVKQVPENISPKNITDKTVSIICLVMVFVYSTFAYSLRKRVIGYETAQKLQQTLLKLNQN
ncbi:hypothetical protein [Neisseria sp. MVDL19-042950]|uniref:hypothetical protein n=1 Tax=Neisseria sp. MVDL19-042950 TaxID=3061169 RepID=UPI00265F7F21|nr:hypothetical protein [Neisseria sp. MVDL19-042950]MDO1510918.1 hypothetical protein [Neisseria sp. MVDL19-042950]